MLSARSKR